MVIIFRELWRGSFFGVVYTKVMYERVCKGEGELTHVTSKETKKRRATLVYPNAALFASMAAL